MLSYFSILIIRDKRKIPNMSDKRGNKIKCSSCGAAFYDMTKTYLSCPKCGIFHVSDKTLQKQNAAKRKNPHKTRKNNSKPNSDLWVCVLEGGNTKATVVRGPSNLNTSSLREPGWYFFKPLKSGETKPLSPKTALHMMEDPSAGIQSYLQTHAFKGVGPETAKKLAVPETYNIFEDLSRPAKEISVAYGINASTATLFEMAWAKTSKTRDIQIMLRQLGLGNAVVKQIRETLGNDVIEEILSNPYELVRKIKYFTFEDAENIVASLNLDLSSDQRIISAMELCLFRIEKNRGHTCAPLERAFKDNDKLIDVDHDIMEGVLRSATEHFKFAEYDDQEHIATVPSFEREHEIASRIGNLLSTGGAPDEHIDFDFDKLNLRASLELSDEQKEALNGAINSRVFLITGGPGTGKTRMVEAIVKALKSEGRYVTLCAPTGRAAKRLEEEGGLGSFSPTTIHLLLTYVKSEKVKDIGTLIIDEASMVDADLMTEILDILNEHNHLIMIGDADQLPPVGPGQVFKDLLNSDKVPVARLTGNFRQTEGSKIIKLARDVIGGNDPHLSRVTSDKGVIFIPESDEDKMQNLVLDLYNTELPRMFNLETSDEVQILTPMRKGTVGTEALNQEIQNTLWGNDEPLFQEGNRKPLYRGDKVIQTSNNYQLDVRNGDIGTILRGGDNGEIFVSYATKDVPYDRESLEALEPAYAISIHKSQGSQYPAVIIPIARSHQFMLGRNLLYTAITRAKAHVVIIGDESAFKAGVNAAYKDFRYTMLRHII
jgi:exodeoxyribonuclease V alpha subunit